MTSFAEMILVRSLHVCLKLLYLPSSDICASWHFNEVFS